MHDFFWVLKVQGNFLEDNLCIVSVWNLKLWVGQKALYYKYQIPEATKHASSFLESPQSYSHNISNIVLSPYTKTSYTVHSSFKKSSNEHESLGGPLCPVLRSSSATTTPWRRIRSAGLLQGVTNDAFFWAAENPGRKEDEIMDCRNMKVSSFYKFARRIPKCIFSAALGLR